MNSKHLVVASLAGGLISIVFGLLSGLIGSAVFKARRVTA